MRLSDTTTYTVLPAAWTKNIHKLLDSSDKIKYEIVNIADMPEYVPTKCIFKGREINHPILCVKSNLIPEELTRAVENNVLVADIR